MRRARIFGGLAGHLDAGSILLIGEPGSSATCEAAMSLLLAPFSFIWRIPTGTGNGRAEWRDGRLVATSAARTSPSCRSSSSPSARGTNHRFWSFSTPHARTKAPHRTYSLRKLLRARGRPGRARTVVQDVPERRVAAVARQEGGDCALDVAYERGGGSVSFFLTPFSFASVWEIPIGTEWQCKTAVA
jgi:hypothetical protein